MNMNKYLYEVFATSEKNQCSDLTIALAMFLADARVGKQMYGPDGLDYEKLHQDYAALAEQEEQLRRFMGRYHAQLNEVYRSGDRMAFEAAVKACEEAMNGEQQAKQK